MIFRMDYQVLVELNSKGWSWQTSCSATRVTFFPCVYSVESCWLQWKTQEELLATMENPRGSYFWLTDYVLELMRNHPLFSTDSQACMYGLMRDKWTRIVASFKGIAQMDAVCDRSHKHLGWGFTTNSEGQRVWATSVESQYPRKLCIALVQIVLQVASGHGVVLRPQSLHDLADHPLLSAKQFQLATGLQPRGNKIPPLVPEFQQTATFFATAKAASDVPCALLGKPNAPLQLRTASRSAKVCQVFTWRFCLRHCHAGC